MIQVSDIIAMFATFKVPIRTNSCFSSSRIFLYPIGSIVSKDIRLSIPIRQSCTAKYDCSRWHEREATAFLIFRHFKFICIMPTRNEFCNAVNNSIRTATSAHETCTFLTSFQTLEALIPQLHEARIRFRKNRVTGVFNITGRYTTMSAPTMEQLISNVLEKQREYRRYIDENRKQKILKHELR